MRAHTQTNTSRPLAAAYDRWREHMVEERILRAKARRVVLRMMRRDLVRINVSLGLYDCDDVTVLIANANSLHT